MPRHPRPLPPCPRLRSGAPAQPQPTTAHPPPPTLIHPHQPALATATAAQTARSAPARWPWAPRPWCAAWPSSRWSTSRFTCRRREAQGGGLLRGLSLGPLGLPPWTHPQPHPHAHAHLCPRALAHSHTNPHPTPLYPPASAEPRGRKLGGAGARTPASGRSQVCARRGGPHARPSTRDPPARLTPSAPLPQLRIEASYYAEGVAHWLDVKPAVLVGMGGAYPTGAPPPPPPPAPARRRGTAAAAACKPAALVSIPALRLRPGTSGTSVPPPPLPHTHTHHDHKHTHTTTTATMHGCSQQLQPQAGAGPHELHPCADALPISAECGAGGAGEGGQGGLRLAAAAGSLDSPVSNPWAQPTGGSLASSPGCSQPSPSTTPCCTGRLASGTPRAHAHLAGAWPSTSPPPRAA